MKILKESKENLPVSFLTDFISKGWEEVGYLKSDIEVIKECFSGTKKIEELIQALVDAYLVCIGQMEAHLQDKDYIEFPEETKLAESVKLAEDINVKVDDVHMNVEADVKVVEDEVEEIIDDIVENEPIKVINKSTAKSVEDDVEPFEYFVDFEEPDLSQPKLTDDDLYR